MKNLYKILIAALFVIVVISTFQDVSARQDPGIPCDPDWITGDPITPTSYPCPIDDYIPFLLLAGAGLYYYSQRKNKQVALV
ncbi:MAG: hypothetical protein EOO42_06180 [Flavobacteriales bacterium]|nr:MAG: hypothetical protein EOO42_06180 [Flavobacteriales bacterium]